MRGSNPRLLAHKTNTLPTELMELNQQVARMAQWIRRLPTEQEILGSSPSMGFFFFWIFFVGKKKKKKKEAPGGTRTRNLCLRRAAPYPLGHRSCNQEMFGWCSWLSRAPHTREVPSSILGSNIFIFLFFVFFLSTEAWLV